MTDVELITKSLTKAQRRIVCELPTDGHYVDAYIYCRQRRTRVSITNKGLTEPYQKGPVTTWWMIRLTSLGLAVRTHLQESRP